MKYSLRDLILITGIVALIIGWRLDRSQLIARYVDHIRKTYNFKWMSGPPELESYFKPSPWADDPDDPAHRPRCPQCHQLLER
jgi:hypothetical protein